LLTKTPTISYNDKGITYAYHIIVHGLLTCRAILDDVYKNTSTGDHNCLVENVITRVKNVTIN